MSKKLHPRLVIILLGAFLFIIMFLAFSLIVQKAFNWLEVATGSTFFAILVIIFFVCLIMLIALGFSFGAIFMNMFGISKPKRR